MAGTQTNTRRRVIIALIILSLAAFLIYYVRYNNHFHAVVPEQVYRSAQFSEQDFEKYIKKYHVRSIINLRGSNKGESWYDNEIKAVNATGINHYDVPLPVQGLPEPQQLAQLVQFIETAPRPILIHCNHGVDRTGFASAIAIILTGNPSWSAAQFQYSYFYLRIDPRSIAPSVMPHYQQWLKRNHLTHSRENFIQWVNASAAANTFDP